MATPALQTFLTRDDLRKVFGDNPKVIYAFEQQQKQVADNTAQTATNVDATTAIQDATVITLSPNETLTRERILAVGTGLQIIDNGPGATVVIVLTTVPLLNGGYDCTINLSADTNVDFPTLGKIPSSAVGPYADDAAAASAGVAIGEIYKGPTGSVVWRQA